MDRRSKKKLCIRREAVKIAFYCFKSSLARISSGVKPGDHDYHLYLVDMQTTCPVADITKCYLVRMSNKVRGSG